MIEGLITLLLLFLFLALGLWVGFALALAGIIGMICFTDFPAGSVLAIQLFNWNNQFVLIALPLFIFMGELLFHSKLNKQLYSGLSPWVSAIPGKLLHSNVLGCTLFAAVSGSSTATLATVGTIAIPELGRLGYDRRLTMGSLCGAGTLGLLIPPSVAMIIYAVLVRESIGQLFMAGIMPGMMVSGLFLSYIAVVSLLRPEVAPSSEKYSLKEKFLSIVHLGPTLLLIFFVLGSMYLGWTTPTESAAAGCLGALLIGLFKRTLTFQGIKDSIIGTGLIAGMMLFIMTGASFYTTTISYLGLSQHLMNLVVSLEVSKYVILAIIALIYIGLGCIIDGASILVLTVPIFSPAMQALGFDLIWLGVVLVILIEISNITPPVGLNLYVLSGITGESIGEVARASLPFFLLLVCAILILIVFPEIALWLPGKMIGG
ncbi:MAG: TRAP transporter large permease subunit [Desulfotignum sp.]|nr:TRAP transporter large permease subunit [Desulfotignum sp.]